LILEDAFNQNMLGSFLLVRSLLAFFIITRNGNCQVIELHCALSVLFFFQANILTGLVNLSVNTLSASSFTACMILSVYTFTLCMVTGLTHFCGVRMKFW
jgi:phosphatidylinositol glycan class W